MPCSYFKAVWGFILIVGPAPTVIQLLLGAFAAAASPPALWTPSPSSRGLGGPEVVEGDEVRYGATSPHPPTPVATRAVSEASYRSRPGGRKTRR